MTGTHIGPKTAAQMDTVFNTVLNSNLSATTKIIRSTTVVVAASDSSAKSKDQADYVCDGTNDEVEIQSAITEGVGGKIVLLEGNYIKGTISGITIPSNTSVEVDGNISFSANVGDGAVIFTNTDAESGNTKISITGNGTLFGNRDNQSTGTQNAIVFTNVSYSKIDIEASGFTGRAITVTDGSNNYARNRLYPNVDILANVRQPIGEMLRFPDITVIDPIDDGSSWTTTSGTVEWTTEVSDMVAFGTSSAKLIMSTYNESQSKYEATISKTFETPISINIYDSINILMRYTAHLSYPLLIIKLTDGDANSLVIYQTPSDVWDNLFYDWKIIGGSQSTADIISETPIDATNITKIDIIARSTVQDSYLYVNGLFSCPPLYPEGSIIITVDDGYENAWSRTAPMMAKYGYKGVAFVNPGLLGAVGTDDKLRLTASQINDLNELGWDICNHTNEHSNLQTGSLGFSEEEILKSRDWLITHGCSDIAFCYPWGGRTPDVSHIVAQYYRFSRLTQKDKMYRTLPIFNSIDMYSAVELTDANLAAVKTLVTNAKTSRSNYIIYMHSVEPTSGINYSISIDNFEDFLSHVSSSGVRVVTFSDLLRDIENKRASPNPKYVTQKSGTATITTSATSVVVTHGLSRTPTNVQVTPKGDVGYCWTDTYTSTQFTIHCSSEPASNTYVNWSAQIV